MNAVVKHVNEGKTQYGVFVCEQRLVAFEHTSVDIIKELNQSMVYNEILMNEIKRGAELE